MSILSLSPSCPVTPSCAAPTPASGSEGLLALSAGLLFRVHTFETRRAGEPRTCLPRTVWCVDQAWGGLRPQVRGGELLGRRVAICTGAFNDYLIARLPGPAELETFGLEDALALWEAARSAAEFADPLRSRLVALAPD